MRYYVYSDNYLIYDSQSDLLTLIEPELNIELNHSGSFNFTIYPNHQYYSFIKKLKSIITVYQNDYLVFRGRIIEDSIGFYNERNIVCEGEYGFLNDTVQRPFNFPINSTETGVEDYFRFLIERHNEQSSENHRFVVGTVTVTDPNNYVSRSDSEFETTYSLLNSGLVEKYGGYIWFDFDADGNRRINYYSDFSTLSTQAIEFGENLLSLQTERSGAEIYTALIPLGYSNEDGEPLMIDSLPDEDTGDIRKQGDLVYSVSAEESYGSRIIHVETWEDVTDSTNLLRKAKERLSEGILQTQTITIRAADLNSAGYNVNSFRLGVYVTVNSQPHSDYHSLAANYLVKKLKISLNDPSNNELELGASFKTFTEQNRSELGDRISTIEKRSEENTTIVVRELEQRLNSEINQKETSILSRVSEGFYTKEETNSLVQNVETEIEQTKDSIEFRFNKVETDADTVQAGNDLQFSEIKKYIRFVDGNIILGEDGNNQTQVITPTRNEFREGNNVVAYIGNRKLYITDGEFLNSLKLGKFAWLPRANGNLSFKKVVD